jgi:hypothetical protein
MKPHPTFCRLGLASLLLLLLNLAWPGLAQAADPPMPIEAYWQKLEQTQALVARLEDGAMNQGQPSLSTLADEWAAIAQVKLADGTIVPVEHSFLVAHLRADPPDLARLNDILAHLLAAHSDWPRPSHQPADLKPLEQILAWPEFQWPPQQPSPLALLWQRLLEFLWDLLSPFIPDTPVVLESSPLRYCLISLGVLVLMLVVAFIARSLLIDFVAQTEIELDSATTSETLTADTAFKKAQDLASAGDYRTAVRYLYLSTLLILDERGLLRYDRSQTNREYLRSVAHLPALASTLREVIEVFDRVWYGYYPLDETTYTKYATQVAELRQQR